VSDFAERFGDVARGLLSLEINTIVKDNMTATRMPSDPLAAVREVAVAYHAWLVDKVPPPFDPPGTSADEAYFATLKAAATSVMGASPSDGVTPAMRILAERLARSSGEIIDLLPKLRTKHPDPDEVVQLRKIWEIGTEEIAFQTVLWIDGDVTQRVIPRYAGADSTHLLAVHGLAVKTSVGMWEKMAQVLVSLFETLWKLVTKG
jgi:hypothetical protein